MTDDSLLTKNFLSLPQELLEKIINYTPMSFINIPELFTNYIVEIRGYMIMHLLGSRDFLDDNHQDRVNNLIIDCEQINDIIIVHRIWINKTHKLTEQVFIPMCFSLSDPFEYRFLYSKNPLRAERFPKDYLMSIKRSNMSYKQNRLL